MNAILWVIILHSLKFALINAMERGGKQGGGGDASGSGKQLKGQKRPSEQIAQSSGSSSSSSSSAAGGGDQPQPSEQEAHLRRLADLGITHKHRAPIWRSELYKRVDDNNAECVECKTNIRLQSRFTEPMIGHMFKEHSNTQYEQTYRAEVAKSKAERRKSLSQLKKIVEEMSGVVEEKEPITVNAPIWDIGLYTKKDPNNATCTRCKKDIRMYKGTTSNLMRHMEKLHNDLVETYNSIKDTKGPGRQPSSRLGSRSAISRQIAEQQNAPPASPSIVFDEEMAEIVRSLAEEEEMQSATQRDQQPTQQLPIADMQTQHIITQPQPTTTANVQFQGGLMSQHQQSSMGQRMQQGGGGRSQVDKGKGIATQGESQKSQRRTSSVSGAFMRDARQTGTIPPIMHHAPSSRQRITQPNTQFGQIASQRGSRSGTMPPRPSSFSFAASTARHTPLQSMSQGIQQHQHSYGAMGMESANATFGGLTQHGGTIPRPSLFAHGTAAGHTPPLQSVSRAIQQQHTYGAGATGTGGQHIPLRSLSQAQLQHLSNLLGSARSQQQVPQAQLVTSVSGVYAVSGRQNELDMLAAITRRASTGTQPHVRPSSNLAATGGQSQLISVASAAAAAHAQAAQPSSFSGHYGGQQQQGTYGAAGGSGLLARPSSFFGEYGQSSAHGAARESGASASRPSSHTQLLPLPSARPSSHTQLLPLPSARPSSHTQLFSLPPSYSSPETQQQQFGQQQQQPPGSGDTQ